jgi:alpha-D-xyloside xylohydrolase
MNETRGMGRQRRALVARARALRVTALAATLAGLAALATLAALAALSGCNPTLPEPPAGTTRAFDVQGAKALRDGAMPDGVERADPSGGLGSTGFRPAGREVPVGDDGVPALEVDGGRLSLEVCADNIIRVAYARDAAFFTRPSLMASPRRCDPGDARVASNRAELTLRTARLGVRVQRRSGRVSFHDAHGRLILVEKPHGRTLTPATLYDQPAQSVRQEWLPNPGESLYGLGQRQDGLLDIRGHDLELKQYNTQIAVPFLVSSRGYGILWDNTSFSRFGDLRPFEPIPGTLGLYTPAGDGNVDSATGSVDWTGDIVAPTTGDYQFETYSGGDIKLWIDDRLVINHWRQGWLPSTDVARVHLEAGQSARVRLAWTADIGVNILRLLWKTPTPEPSTSLWSKVGDGIDYYFVYGPRLDDVIGGYRQITGPAPMMPSWAFGLFQSRERYQTQQDSLTVAAGFRSRGAPVDVIVQDWQYWTVDAWGSHLFDPIRFPDPDGWIDALHDTYHTRLMISVWPKFYRGSQNFDELRAGGFLFERNLIEGKIDFLGYPFTYYDAFDPGARALYWEQMRRHLFVRGVDAWWMDATEPEIVEGPYPTPRAQLETFEGYMHPTALGSGASVLNAYSLVNSEAVYAGQRAAAPDQRVFILTRNGFAGQQRYAAASWSGDISSTWTAFQKQIPAGLSFSLSGIPYWTVDSGGFSVPPWFAYDPTPERVLEWNELNTRWFQYATFLPLLRVHGQFPLREMWEFGGDDSPSYHAMLFFDRLRYRMQPYLYSLAGAVTHEGGTLLRPLVMDHPHDEAARDVRDQFGLGPSLMVSPVTAYLARTRPVYLPSSTTWYDLWTGEAFTGGQTISAAAPYESIPVHVPAGSILPFGPELQYTREKPADPIVLYVYAGADGAFTLYEDDGTTYGYERGEWARIAIHWDDAAHTLRIGAREGAFPGMLAERTFEVVLVTPTKGVGFSFSPVADAVIRHAGEALEVQVE